MYEINRKLTKNDRRWFFVFVDTFYLKTLSFWAQTLNSYTLFRKLNVFLQQFFDFNQLLLTLKTLTNLNEMQLEVKQYFDVDQLILTLKISTNSNKLQFQIKSISDINARFFDQQNNFCSKISMNNDLLSKFDSIFKHIHFIAFNVARSNEKCFNSYVQNMLYWNSRDFNINHHSKHFRIKNYWWKKFTKKLFHQNILNEIKTMKTKNANDNRRFL